MNHEMNEINQSNNSTDFSGFTIDFTNPTSSATEKDNVAVGNAPEHLDLEAWENKPVQRQAAPTDSLVPEPKVEWLKQFGGSGFDSVADMAIDTNGNAYLIGSTSNNIDGNHPNKGGTWFAKYNNQGDRLWIKQLDKPLDSPGNPHGIATDISGNIYLTGDIFNSNDFSDPTNAWLGKYDTNGQELWTKQFGSSKQDTPQDIGTDKNGNVYLTGNTYGGDLAGTNAGSSDAWIVKYDSTGEQVWKQQFGSSASEGSYGVATDNSGNVYLTGYTDGDLAGTNAGSSDAWIVKYDTNGKQIWKQQLGSSEYDQSLGVATDKSGNIYLTGNTEGNLAGNSAGWGDLWLAKYDTNGKQIWKQQFGSSGYDQSFGVTTDKSGNIYLTGITNGNLVNNNAGGWDAWAAVYNSSGNLLFAQQAGTSSYDESKGIAVDGSGNVYLAGSTEGNLGGIKAGLSDIWVAKLNPPSLPKVSISATDAKARETIAGETTNPGAITITRAGDTTKPLTVNYTLSGKAVNGTDYTQLTTSAIIPAGQTQVVVSVDVTDDLITESTEGVSFTLAANPSYLLGTSKSATVNIFDNEKPVLFITAIDASASETKIGETANSGRLKVSRFGDLSSPLVVNRKVSGTATKDTDFKFPNQISLAAGASSVTLPVNILDDALVEGLETATVTLTAGTTYKLSSTRSGTVNIADND
jgi:hypothetical protein